MKMIARTTWATALLAAAALAHAAPGVTIDTDDETLVSPGIDAAAVQLALGKPALERSYRNEPGPTWTYRLADKPQTLFDVQFDARGAVVSATERADESGRGHGHR
jgi:hypothetical protein